MKILVFTEGTLIMHRNAVGHAREEIVEQVKANEESIHDYAFYVPIGNAVEKLKAWEKQGAEILYLTSRTKPEEIEDIVRVLEKHDFLEGLLLSRRGSEDYKDVAERIAPDILIEDDCESIGGEDEMTITHIRPEIKREIKSISAREFGGIEHLPDRISALMNFREH